MGHRDKHLRRNWIADRQDKAEERRISEEQRQEYERHEQELREEIQRDAST